MAQGDGALYNEFKEELFLGNLDMDGNTFKVILVTGYTPNIDTHNGLSDVTANQVSGSGYTAGGATLSNKTVTKDTTNDRAKFDADDVTWTALNAGTPSHAILYSDTHATDCLIAYWEVTTPSNGGNYTLQWGANGIVLLT